MYAALTAILGPATRLSPYIRCRLDVRQPGNAVSTEVDDPGRFGGVALAILRANLRLIFAVAALVLLYALAGFFLVPRVVRSQLESFVTDELHQQVTLGEVHFNPFVFDTQPDLTQLDTLARARAQAVQGAILANTEVEPQRVFVTTDRPAAVNADVIRMELKLE